MRVRVCIRYGKMLVKDKGAFDDLRSVLMLGREYYTIEAFRQSYYDIRLTRVGGAERSYAYKRILVSEDDRAGGCSSYLTWGEGAPTVALIHLFHLVDDAQSVLFRRRRARALNHWDGVVEWQCRTAH